MKEIYEKMAGPDESPEIFEALADWVLPWSKKNHPEKYGATLAVVTKPKTFLGYLARLAEIRWEEEDMAGRLSAPLRALELTGVSQRMTTSKGRQILVQGRLAVEDGVNRSWTWEEVALAFEAGRPEEMDDLYDAKEILDLEVADNPAEPPPPLVVEVGEQDADAEVDSAGKPTKYDKSQESFI